jgi:hypothetical protein
MSAAAEWIAELRRLLGAFSQAAQEKLVIETSANRRSNSNRE